MSCGIVWVLTARTHKFSDLGLGSQSQGGCAILGHGALRSDVSLTGQLIWYVASYETSARANRDYRAVTYEGGFFVTHRDDVYSGWIRDAVRHRAREGSRLNGQLWG